MIRPLEEPRLIYLHVPQKRQEDEIGRAFGLMIAVDTVDPRGPKR